MARRVGPSRRGAAVADGAAAPKAAHRGLGPPDAIALAVAELIDADAVWSFDRRLRAVDRRVAVPWSRARRHRRPAPRLAAA